MPVGAQMSDRNRMVLTKNDDANGCSLRPSGRPAAAARLIGTCVPSWIANSSRLDK